MDRKSLVDPHIGQRLKEYRQHRGMTVRELAEAAHVTPGQISRYEHGRDRISHERATEFARILRIKSTDLYQPPGSRLRRNHVRWRLTNFIAAVIAEAAALMSSRRKAAADNEAAMIAAVAAAVAVSATAAAASDAEKISTSLTISGDDTAVDLSGSASNAALKFNSPHRTAETVTDYERAVAEGKLEIVGAVSGTTFRVNAEAALQFDASDATNVIILDGNTDIILPRHYTGMINTARGKVGYDRSVSADEETSGQSSSAEKIASNPSSGNENLSTFQPKPSSDHHASDDPKVGDIANSDNFKFKFADHDEKPATSKDKSSIAKVNDDHEKPATSKDKSSVAKVNDDDEKHVTSKDKSADNDHSASTDSEKGDIAKAKDLDPQSDNFKFADEGGIAKSQPPAHKPAHVHHKKNGEFTDDDGVIHDDGSDDSLLSVTDAQSDGSAHPGKAAHDPPGLAKKADDDSAHPGKGPNKVDPGHATGKGTVMSDATSDQFIFGKGGNGGKGNGTVADAKPDKIEPDHAVTEIQHLLHTAHDANAADALNPNHTTGPKDMTKVPSPHHQGDFHFA